MPFSARKSADFPSNHGRLFRASTSLNKRVVSKPSTHPSLQLVGTSGLIPPRCPDRQEEDLPSEHHQGAWREDFDIEQIRWGQAISQMINPIFVSLSGQ